MARIRKPTTNPLIPALLNLCLPSGLGYLVMRQSHKAVIAFALYLLLSCFCCSPLIAVLTALDAFLLGLRLRRGEAIGERECAIGLLQPLFK